MCSSDLAKIIKTKKNIELFGAVSRYKMLKIADTCDAAICLYTSRGKNINFKNMVGAANKPFDAMARGLAVVVSDLEEWKRLYLPGKKLERGNGYWISDMGYGIAINPESRESIRAGLEWMLANREKLWEMGERGRLKIETTWNYGSMFRQVAQRLENN